MVAMLSFSSALPYTPDIPIQPSPIGKTEGPEAPSWRMPFDRIGSLAFLRFNSVLPEQTRRGESRRRDRNSAPGDPLPRGRTPSRPPRYETAETLPASRILRSANALGMVSNIGQA